MYATHSGKIWLFAMSLVAILRHFCLISPLLPSFPCERTTKQWRILQEKGGKLPLRMEELCCRMRTGLEAYRCPGGFLFKWSDYLLFLFQFLFFSLTDLSLFVMDALAVSGTLISVGSCWNVRTFNLVLPSRARSVQSRAK